MRERKPLGGTLASTDVDLLVCVRLGAIMRLLAARFTVKWATFWNILPYVFPDRVNDRLCSAPPAFRCRGGNCANCSGVMGKTNAGLENRLLRHFFALSIGNAKSSTCCDRRRALRRRARRAVCVTVTYK